MTIFRTRQGLIYLVSAILVVSGCASGSNYAIGQQVDGVREAESNPVPTDDSFAAVMNIVTGSSLTFEESQYHWEVKHNQIQELIAVCMKEAGFDYIPVPPNKSGAAANPNLVQPDNRDWVAQWGYMVVNRPYESERENRIEQEHSDPNTAVMERLNESERDAFRSALEGAAPLYEDGCRNWAYAQPQPQTPSDLVNSDEFAPLFEALNEMYVNLDNEIAEPERDWSECMAEAGHPGITRPWDAGTIISDAYFEWNVTQNWDEWDWDTLGEPNSTNVPELAVLADREIELALADFDCRQTVDFESRMEARRLAAENQFYLDNHAAMRALRDAAEQLNWS